MKRGITTKELRSDDGWYEHGYILRDYFAIHISRYDKKYYCDIRCRYCGEKLEQYVSITQYDNQIFHGVMSHSCKAACFKGILSIRSNYRITFEFS